MRISDWSSDVCSSDLGVAEIVGKRQRFGQILVELEAARQPAGDLRHLDAMRQPGTIMVALGCDEDLGLVLESAKGRRMDDPIPIALEAGSRQIGRAHV